MAHCPVSISLFARGKLISRRIDPTGDEVAKQNSAVFIAEWVLETWEFKNVSHALAGARGAKQATN